MERRQASQTITRAAVCPTCQKRDCSHARNGLGLQDVSENEQRAKLPSEVQDALAEITAALQIAKPEPEVPLKSARPGVRSIKPTKPKSTAKKQASEAPPEDENHQWASLSDLLQMSKVCLFLLSNCLSSECLLGPQRQCTFVCICSARGCFITGRDATLARQ